MSIASGGTVSAAACGTSVPEPPGSTVRRRIAIRGVVQGVGFRPFVARLAAELDVRGCCGNDDRGLFIEAEGPPTELAEFTDRLRAESPPMSVILDVTSEPVPPQGDDAFRIVGSRQTDGVRTLVPPDVATCADCLAEFDDPADRRYRHPFVNCTNCGPRLTVVTDLPYDRPATTMVGFPMCPACRREYTDPTDRRYHAQPVCCPGCGPRIHLEEGDRRTDGDDAVLARVQEALRGGAVVAIKGLGGFHLACDATDQAAVDRLRTRKRRPDKPFAVMVPDLAAAAELCQVSDADAAALTLPARPIVLLPRRAGAAVADAVAPGLDELGVLLPYTPLHHLLFRPVPGGAATPPRVLVMTSGNLGGEPLCYDDDDARSRLGGIADLFLMHDRPIAVPCEDSVVAGGCDAPVPVRRSRGYAPLPVLLPAPAPVVLAVGAELKNTFCLTRGDYAFCSAHLGDMGSLASQQAFEASVRQLTGLHRVTPELVVADDHPGYASRQWAERYSADTGTPLTTVQHHHAHVASLMAERRLLGTRVLGVAFDGTGHGCDRTAWGGELLLVGPDVREAVRAGHLQPFPLPGGDVAVRTPARVALALLHAAGLSADPESMAELPCARALPDAERRLIASQLASGAGCVATTSVGRLFDGVASLLGVRHRISYEAQAAIELEARARAATRAEPLTMDVEGDRLGLRTLLAGLVDGLRRGVAVPELAYGFHVALAAATVRLAARLATDAGVGTVGLTGGVFQNRILLRLMAAELAARGLTAVAHDRVPANDGGLSLGQAVIGAAIARETAREVGGTP